MRYIQTLYSRSGERTPCPCCELCRKISPFPFQESVPVLTPAHGIQAPETTVPGTQVPAGTVLISTMHIVLLPVLAERVGPLSTQDRDRPAGLSIVQTPIIQVEGAEYHGRIPFLCLSVPYAIHHPMGSYAEHLFREYPGTQSHGSRSGPRSGYDPS